jgi:hypothetical protein
VQRCDEIATTDASQSQLALVQTIQTITVVLSVFVLVQASCTFRCRDRIELVTELVPTVGVPRPIAQVIDSPTMVSLARVICAPHDSHVSRSIYAQ